MSNDYPHPLSNSELNSRIPSLLVANRGEIAVRIFRTCRRLGIRTIAVYSDADRFSRHVREADVAYRLGLPEAKESYLNLPALLDAIARSSCAAVHPGYGFLSENGAFASAVEQTGARFLGPTQQQMAELGDKSNAKNRAKQLGLPLLESIPIRMTSAGTPVALPAEVTYPLLLKANAGGGGRGMRVVRSAGEFDAAAVAAGREALSFFGDGSLFVERFIERGRHIEVQMLGDGTGDVIAIGDRDCTVQRRYQKVIEESPAFGLAPEVRARIWNDATRLLSSVSYRGAGTVEFLLTPSGEYFFLEVNTRLQVEHPVTEVTTGLDLVELMIRVGAGESLRTLIPDQQRGRLLEDATTGAGLHGIELRLCAEKPHEGFAPATGTIAATFFPDSCRVDSGFETLDRVSHYYDSLLAKIIVTGRSRLAACEAALEALRRPLVVGIDTNQDFLRQILLSPIFQAGEHHTRWVDLEPELSVPPALDYSPTVELPDQGTQNREGANQAVTAYRVGFNAPKPVLCIEVDKHQSSGTQREVARGGPGEEVLPSGPKLVAPPSTQSILRTGRGDFALIPVVGCPPGHYRAQLIIHRSPQLRASVAAAEGQAGVDTVVDVVSPLPGKILEIHVTPGTTVTEGQVLMTFESMKMEHPVKAPVSGQIKEMCVSPQQVIDAGGVLARLAPRREA